MFTNEMKARFAEMGISAEKAEEQLARFASGFPYLKISAAATVGSGISAFDEAEMEEYEREWTDYLATEGRKVVKFVPASGAASRMFKDLFAFADGSDDVLSTDFEKTFFARLHDFAFYTTLSATCERLHGLDADALVAEGRYKDVVKALLDADGMNYGSLPKGLLEFHRYSDGTRTPFEEHLVEAAGYARDADGRVNLHFTVSADHEELFAAQGRTASPRVEARLGVKTAYGFSQQKKSTDTIAATEDNLPFVEADGTVLFRPGGHGALIENLNDLDADIVFIKNIDNVVPDRLKDDCNSYKRLMAGVLVRNRRIAFDYLRHLDSGRYTMSELRDMLHFTRHTLCCKNPETKYLEDTELAVYLRRKLNRPFRVCAMVRNVGEPGGGPFLAYDKDGTISPQILESAQIDMANADMRQMFENGTHFNPADLVCGITDYKGRKFDLRRFVDPDTGFISSKSKDGKVLKALELPGLWNGAMSDWNTIFVEVPLSTFNPVKTVNDLIRPEHRG